MRDLLIGILVISIAILATLGYIAGLLKALLNVQHDIRLPKR